MPDLMLDEYRGLSRDKLNLALREVARKMYGNGWIEKKLTGEKECLTFTWKPSTQAKRNVFF